MIYAHLKTDGYFLNIDVMLAPTEALDGWYMKLWQDESFSLSSMGRNAADIILKGIEKKKH